MTWRALMPLAAAGGVAALLLPQPPARLAGAGLLVAGLALAAPFKWAWLAYAGVGLLLAGAHAALGGATPRALALTLAVALGAGAGLSALAAALPRMADAQGALLLLAVSGGLLAAGAILATLRAELPVEEAA